MKQPVPAEMHERWPQQVEPSEPATGPCLITCYPIDARGSESGEPRSIGHTARGARAVRRGLRPPRTRSLRGPTIQTDPWSGTSDRAASAVHRGARRKDRDAGAGGLFVRRLATGRVRRGLADHRPGHPGQPARALSRTRAQARPVEDRRTSIEGLPARRAEPGQQPRRDRRPGEHGDRGRGRAPRRLDGPPGGGGVPLTPGRSTRSSSASCSVRSARVSPRLASRVPQCSGWRRPCRGCVSTSRSRSRSKTWPAWST